MASTANLRLRRSAAQLTALEGVEREIRAQDSHSRRKYLREFNQAFQNYKSVLNREQLVEALSGADVVLMGDYHALPASQRYAAHLLEQRALIGDRPVVLGLETIFARDQHIVDEWWRREIDEAEFRERIRFDLDWGYDWTPFYELLLTARDHAEALYGLDCMPRDDLRKIGARDRHAALKLAEIRRIASGTLALARRTPRPNAGRQDSDGAAECGCSVLACSRRADRCRGRRACQR
jgi:Haem-binding uptake, Tiki superfamily, ChaN